MSKQGKLWALLFLTMAVLAVWALASGVSNVSTAPAAERVPLGLQEKNGGDEDATAPLTLPPLSPETTRAVLWMLAAVGFLAVGFILWRVRHLPPPEQQSSLLRAFVFALGAVLIALSLDRLGLNLTPNRQPGQGTLVVPALTPTAAVSIGIGILLLSLLFLALYAAWQRLRPVSPLDQLAQEAEQTIDALQAGADLHHAIVRCYSRMCTVLRQEMRVERHRAMTAREFAAGLEAHGVAGPEVTRLTQLFEMVRYGGEQGRQLNADHDAEAIRCLQAILAAARRRQGRGRRVPAGSKPTTHHAG